MLKRVDVAIRPFPRAALFELAAEGHASVFEQLAACIISTRTRDETTIAVARRLFAAAPTPEAVSRLGPARLDELIEACTFTSPRRIRSTPSLAAPWSSAARSPAILR